MSIKRLLFLCCVLFFLIVGYRVVSKQYEKTGVITQGNRLKNDTQKENFGKSIIYDEVDNIASFFSKNESKFPIVETITYSSRVPWLDGRNAWIADYASHYKTSRHFIARSMHQKTEYYAQNVANGDTFNVLDPNKKFAFHLIVDKSLCKMWFYYIDLELKEKCLVKTYSVGLGRKDENGDSLTPSGQFVIGERVATYKPGSNGTFQGNTVDMIEVFGTRWLPFDTKKSPSMQAKGYGIHGAPFIKEKSGDYVENLDPIASFQSDGCVRLANRDMEELFSIVISRPTFVEIVDSVSESMISSEVNEEVYEVIASLE